MPFLITNFAQFLRFPACKGSGPTSLGITHGVSQIAAQTDPFLSTSPLAIQTKVNVKQHTWILVTLESGQK